MHRNIFLLVTAVGEGLTGLFLLLLPAVPLALLLGLSAAAAETSLVARVAGIAIVAIAVMSGMAHGDAGSPALRAVLTGILIYDVAVAAVLAYAGIGLRLAGILLWPAVVAHVLLAIWCLACLRTVQGAER
jgi:hypothetical protein